MKPINNTFSLGSLVALLSMVCIFTSFSCLAPAFSELQSARLAGPGHVEVTPSYSRVSGQSGHTQDHYGIQAGVGILKRLDLRIRYEHASVYPGEAESFGVNMLGFGPKVALIPNWLTVYVPVGFAFGEEIEASETWQVHPTLLATLPLNTHFEINTSAKALIPLQDESDPMYAVNFGVAVSSDVRRWAVRPEIGFLFNSPVGSCLQMSIGLSLSTDRSKRR
ncbi:MAG: hypothetical protein JXE07_02490 [Candidatus Aminicenantes bacterium]|nr:hypothetical protein [Candidatus Aminicenantes bacterium]